MSKGCISPLDYIITRTFSNTRDDQSHFLGIIERAKRTSIYTAARPVNTTISKFYIRSHISGALESIFSRYVYYQVSLLAVKHLKESPFPVVKKLHDVLSLGMKYIIYSWISSNLKRTKELNTLYDLRYLCSSTQSIIPLS